MAVDMINFYTLIGVEEGIRIRITAEKSGEIHELIKGLDDFSEAATCIRALLNRYPEESVLDFCFQRLIELRPMSMGPKYHAWRSEVTAIVESLRRNSIPEWEGILREKMRVIYPKVAMNMWPTPVQSQSMPD